MPHSLLRASALALLSALAAAPAMAAPLTYACTVLGGDGGVPWDFQKIDTVVFDRIAGTMRLEISKAGGGTENYWPYDFKTAPDAGTTVSYAEAGGYFGGASVASANSEAISGYADDAGALSFSYSWVTPKVARTITYACKS